MVLLIEYNFQNLRSVAYWLLIVDDLETNVEIENDWSMTMSINLFFKIYDEIFEINKMFWERDEFENEDGNGKI